MVRLLWGVILLSFVTGCGGFTSNNSAERFTLVAPSHTNVAAVHITGVCQDTLEDLTVTVTGNFTGSPLALTCTDGQYEANITVDQAQTDLEATQETYSATAQIIFDTTSPTVNITNPANGGFVGVQVSVSGTCEADLPVALTGDLQNNINTSCNESGQFTATVQFNLLPTVGQRELIASQTDLAGNTGTDNATYDFDNTVPEHPNLTLNISAGNPSFPSDPQVSADTTPVLTGTVADADGGSIEIFADSLCATPAIGSQTIPSGGNLNISNISFASDGSADGLKRFYARVTGVNGVQNPGGCYSTLLSYRLDTTPPVIAVASPQNGQSYYAGSSLLFSGTCENGTPVEITLDGSTYQAPCSSSAFSTSLNLPGAAGSTTATFTQTDLANLNTSESVTFTLTLGPPANPEIIITSPTSGSVIDVSSPVIVSGTCTSHPVMSSTITFTGNVVGTTTTTCLSDGTAYGGTFSATLQFSTVASPTLTATQIKTDTNTSYTSTVNYQVAPANPTTLTLNYDAGHPTYITTPPSSQDTTPTITGTVSLAALGTLFIYSDSSCSQLVQNYNVPSNGNVNITSLNYQNNGSDDGDKHFYAILHNSHGTPNVGGCTAVGSYKLDTTAPALALTSHTNGETYYLESLQNFTGSCESGAPIELTVGTQSFTPACVSGAFTQNVLLPNTGSSISLALVQTDAANNTTEINHTYSLAVAPASSITITIDNPAQHSTVDPTVPTEISGTCTYHTDMSPVVLTGDISASVNATCNSDGSAYGGTYSANVTFNSVPSPTLTATQTNNFNAESNSANKQYYVAPTDPALTLTVTPSGAVSKDTTPVISGTVTMANNGTIQIFEDAMCAIMVQTSSVSSTGVINLSLNYDNDGTDDGLHHYYAQVTAQNGTTNPSGCFNTGLSYTLDTIAPTVTLTSHTEGSSYYANSSQTLQGACENGPLVELNVGGVNYTSTCNDGTYNRVLTFPTALGDTTVSFSQTDAAGNTGIDSITVNVSLPPPTSVSVAITSPSGGSTVTHLMETTVSGTCAYHPDISTVEIWGDIDSSVFTPCLSDGSDYGGTFEADVIFNPVAHPTLRARQRKISSGTLYPSLPITYVLLNFDAVFTMNLDPGNPNIPSDPPVSADTTPSLTGTLPEAEGLMLSLFEDDMCSDTAIATQTVPSNGEILLGANYNNDGSDDGLHSYYAQVSSGSFQSDCLDLELSYVLDTQAPDVNLTSHSAASTYLVSSTQTLSGSCESGLNVALDVGGTSYTVTCSSNAFAQLVTFPSSPGSLLINYSQVDAANNTTSKSLTLTVDTLPPPGDPELEFDVVHGNPELPTTPITSNQIAVSITGTVSNADGAMLSIYDNDNTCSSSPIESITLDASGNVEVTLMYMEIGQNFDGVHHYYAKVLAPGNVPNPGGCVDTELTYTLDTHPPELLLNAPLNNASFYATSTQTFSGFCESGAPVKFNFGSAVPQEEVANCVDDEFSINITLPADVATISYQFMSTDAAGNESATTNRSINLTLPPPPSINLAITSPADNSGVSASTTTVSGACTVHAEMSQVTLTGDIASPVSVNCITDGVSTYGGTFTANVTFNDQPLINLTASQTNNYMTPVTATDSVTYVIPPSDPTLSITLQPGNPAFPSENPPHTAGTTPIITGSVVKGTGGTLELFTDNTCSTKLTDTVVGAGDVVNVTLNLDTDGLYELYGLVTMPTTHTNPSGCHNTGLSFILDTGAPVVTLTSHNSVDTYLTGSAQTLEGACENDLPVNLTVDGTSYSTSCAAGVYSQAVTFPATPKTMTVTFHQTDKAGNTNASGSMSMTVVAPPPNAPALALQIADGNPLYTQTTPATSSSVNPVLSGTVTNADGGFMTVYADSNCTQELGVSSSIAAGEVTATLNFENDGSDDGLHEFFVIVTANSQSTACIDTGLSYILDTQISVTLDTFGPSSNQYYPGYRLIQGECSDNDKDVIITLTPSGTEPYYTAVCNNNTYSAVIELGDANPTELSYKHDDLADNLITHQLDLEPLTPSAPTNAYLALDPSITTVPVAPNKAILFGECTHGALFSKVNIRIETPSSYTEDLQTPCFATSNSEHIGEFRIEVELPNNQTSFDIDLEQHHPIYIIDSPPTVTVMPE